MKSQKWNITFSSYLYRLSSLWNTFPASPPHQFLSDESSVLPASLCKESAIKKNLIFYKTQTQGSTLVHGNIPCFFISIWILDITINQSNVKLWEEGFTSAESSKNIGQKNSCVANIVNSRSEFYWFVGLQLLCFKFRKLILFLDKVVACLWQTLIAVHFFCLDI